MFDYNAAADLYFGSGGTGTSRKRVTYRHFAHASAALKFAVEQLSPAAFNSTFLEVEDARFNSVEIRALYEKLDFSLSRSAVG